MMRRKIRKEDICFCRNSRVNRSSNRKVLRFYLLPVFFLIFLIFLVGGVYGYARVIDAKTDDELFVFRSNERWTVPENGKIWIETLTDNPDSWVVIKKVGGRKRFIAQRDVGGSEHSELDDYYNPCNYGSCWCSLSRTNDDCEKCTKSFKKDCLTKYRVKEGDKIWAGAIKRASMIYIYYKEKAAPTCPDNDDDGYQDIACEGDDCNDNDANINPGAVEICDDNIDNDCDTLTDCDDADCAGDAACMVSVCSDENQRVMKISAESDALGSLWNIDNNYPVEICYNDIFGSAYEGADPHTCTGNNKVVGLSAETDADAEIPSLTNFPESVCYDNLACEVVDRTVTVPGGTIEGLEAYWWFDERPKDNPKIKDSSGNDNTYIETGSFVDKRKRGKVERSVGIDLQDGGTYIFEEGNGLTTLNKQGRITGLTIEAWVNLKDVTPTGGDHWGFGDFDIIDAKNYYLRLKVEELNYETTFYPTFTVDVGARKRKTTVYTDKEFGTQKWKHIAAVYNKTSSEEAIMKIYVNGKPRGRKKITLKSGQGEIDTSEINRMIMAYNDPDDFYYDYLYLDEVAIFYTALGKDTIKKHFENGKAGEHYETTIEETESIDPSITCESEYPGQGYEHAVSLLDETDALLESALLPIDQQTYPYMVCCKAEEFVPIGDRYWANMKGDRIGNDVETKAQLGDTVKMVWENTGLAEGADVSFEIYEDDPLFDDEIKTGENAITAKVNAEGIAVGTWTITQADLDKTSDLGEFIFIVGGDKSNELEIEETPNNAKPEAVIVKPELDDKFKVNTEIDFEEASEDEDDPIKVIWDFGDGSAPEEKLNCNMPGGNCDTTHAYAASGTKIIKLTAKEMVRGQEDSENTRIFIYDEGTNVFAVITEPGLNDPVIGKRWVDFDGSKSYVAECSTTGCPDPLPDGVVSGCYQVEDLYCYDFPNTEDWIKPKADGGKHNLLFEWSFDVGDGRSGNWLENYDTVVEFKRFFETPGEHWAKLKVGYDDLSGE